MFRTLVLASAISLGAAGIAAAQGGPVLVGGGGDGGPQVVYDSIPTNNILGGAQVRLSGGANDRSYQYGQVNSFPGQVGTLVGGGNEAHVVYTPMPQTSGVASVGIGAPHS